MTALGVKLFKNYKGSVDKKFLNNGHDLLNAISYLIRKEKNGLNLPKNEIYQKLLEKYTKTDFKNTNLYLNLRQYLIGVNYTESLN